MPNPLLVVILGAPCTGKTILARRLAQALHLPLLGRDTIKEALFDSLGWSDRAWSRKLGGASFDVLFRLAEEHLRAGASLIVETNFRPQWHTAPWRDMQGRVPFDPLQIFCLTESEALLQRRRVRSTSGERHPGHVDHLNEAEFMSDLGGAGTFGPLEIGGPVLRVDTTDFAHVDYAGLVHAVYAELTARPRPGMGTCAGEPIQ